MTATRSTGPTRRATGRRPRSVRRSSRTSRPVGSAPPSPIRPHPTAGASGPRSRPRSSPCFADRTTLDWTAGPLTFRDRAAVPPRDDLAGGPWRIVPGGTAVRRGAHLGDGRRRDAAVVRQRRRLGRRRLDGRFARARRVVRPDRRARPPRGGRHDRWRARAAGRAAGHRRGRRVRRRGQRPARGRARRSRRGHRGRGHADRDVAAVRPRPGPGPRGHAWTRRSPSRPRPSSSRGRVSVDGAVRGAARAVRIASRCWSRIATPARRRGSRSKSALR